MESDNTRRRNRAGAGRKPGGSAALVLELLGEAKPPGTVTALRVAEVISQRLDQLHAEIERLRRANTLICIQRDEAIALRTEALNQASCTKVVHCE
jgi:hypothetical protein